MNNDDNNNVYDWYTKEKMFFELKAKSNKSKLGSHDLDDKCCQPSAPTRDKFLDKLESSICSVQSYLDDLLDIIDRLKR